MSTNLLPIAPQLLPENKRFYPALNGLRAVAVLMVFFEHYINHNNVYPSLDWGWAGVSIFFVLSGFLITGILYDTANARNPFKVFYARRALRIFPLYYAVLLFALCLYPVLHWKLYPTWVLFPLYLHNFARFVSVDTWRHANGAVDHLIPASPSLANFTLLTGHFWSLCVEEQFYLFWPLVVIFIKDRVTLRNICLAGFIGLFFLKILCVLFVPWPYLAAGLLYSCSPFCMDALLLGGFITLLRRGPEWARFEPKVRPALYSLLLLLACGLTGYALVKHHLFHPDVVSRFTSTFVLLFVDLFCALLLLVALEPGTKLFCLLCLAPLRALGEISYGFYIFHDLFHVEYLAIVRQTLHLSPIATENVTSALAFVCTLILAFLSFRFFELPILKLKSRFQVET